MKSQEIFNRVLTHLRKQGRASMTENSVFGTTCAYRGTNGDMCAVGCLITDEAYDPDLEGENVQDSNVLNMVEASIGRIRGRQPHLLLRLQIAHDEYMDRGMGIWEEEMQRIADEFGLKYAPPV